MKTLHGVGSGSCPGGVACGTTWIDPGGESLRCRYQMMRVWEGLLRLYRDHASDNEGRRAETLRCHSKTSLNVFSSVQLEVKQSKQTGERLIRLGSQFVGFELSGEVNMESKNARLGLQLFGVYLLFYGGFVFMSAFKAEWMELTPFAGINLAILYGFGLIVAALVLALIYGATCKGEDVEPPTGVGSVKSAATAADNAGKDAK